MLPEPPKRFPHRKIWEANLRHERRKLSILFGERAGARTQDPVIKSHGSIY